MSPSLWQIAVVVVIVLLLFGRGKISGLMGDVAKGIRNFKTGLKEDPTGDTARTADAGKDAIEDGRAGDAAAPAQSKSEETSKS